MSFRKKSAVIRAPSRLGHDKAQGPSNGTRPSPLDARPTTSTGTASLDQLLAGHAGLPLGSSLLVEEAGATDFGGTLLRYYAAEGLVQGHDVHLLGAGDVWRRELPGLASRAKPGTAETQAAPPDKMRIAWRYEALGSNSKNTPEAQPAFDEAQSFCHAFDLTKRLETSAIRGRLHSCPSVAHQAQPPFQLFISDVASRLRAAPPSSIHRILVPGLLSPTLYGPAACQPHQVLQFLHSLRALLRQFPTQATALVTLPVSLYPRSSGLTRWMELILDGVIELIPLQRHPHVTDGHADEAQIQGLLRVHSLPVFHEKGGGLEGGWVREDMSFKLSASRGMVIMPFSLPPLGEEKKGPEPGDQKDTLEF